VTKGENTEDRLCGVYLMMSAMQSSGKKSLNGKSVDCKNDFLKRLISRVMQVLIVC